MEKSVKMITIEIIDKLYFDEKQKGTDFYIELFSTMLDYVSQRLTWDTEYEVSFEPDKKCKEILSALNNKFNS